MSDPFLAQIQIWTSIFTPKDWADCKGDLLSISQNAALFSIVGSRYGGNGHNNFAIPNLQGRSVMGWGIAPGLTYRVLGEKGGAPGAYIHANQMPAHNHGSIYGQKETKLSNTAVPASNVIPARRKNGAVPSVSNPAFADNPEAYMNQNTISYTGGSNAHENRQPFLAVKFCIALVGEYPVRS